MRYKTYWLVGILLLLAVAIFSFFNTDSPAITTNKTNNSKDKEVTFSLVIEQYPELQAYENDLLNQYNVKLQSQSAEFKQYKCSASPEVFLLSFNYLRPKQNIYRIESPCRVPGETSPYGSMPDLLFFVKQGQVLMFKQKDLEVHFPEVFSNISSLDELKEYSENYVDNLEPDLNSALNHSLISRTSPDQFKQDCSFTSEIPKLNSTVSKVGSVFVYEGLRIAPEGRASLSYQRYNITSEGQIIKDSEKMLALCQNIGIIY